MITCVFKIFTTYPHVGPKCLKDLVNLNAPYLDCEKRRIYAQQGVRYIFHFSFFPFSFSVFRFHWV